MTPRLLRALAIVVALAGAIDPPVTSLRPARPDVAVIDTGGPGGAALAARVATDLGARFAVVRGPFTGAAAVVAVGDRAPDDAGAYGAPAFAVDPATGEPRVSIETIDAPAAAPLDARVPIAVRARVAGARGRTLVVTLEQGGLVVDRVTNAIAGDDVRVPVALTFVPTGAGAAPLRVVARISDVPASMPSATASADLAVDVRDGRRAVFVFDGRPSWMSTFVRRALEADSTFVVSSRVVTSRDVSTDTGRQPGALDLTSLALFDAVVVGAPETLTARDVAGLDAFMRRRGGAVVLLFDQRVPGPYERLTGVERWAEAASGKPVNVGAESTGVQASEIAWPVRLPPGGEVLAASEPPVLASAAAAPAGRRPIVWRTPVGGGRLIVSGALDAWRFRDPASAAFDRFWRTVVADATGAAPRPIEVRVASPVLAPDETTTVRVTLRDAALADAAGGRAIAGGVAAAIETPDGGQTPVRLWPDGPVGEFVATVRAPARPGVYQIVATSAGARAAAPIVVQAAVTAAAADARDLRDVWAASRGGESVPASRAHEVGDAIARAIHPESRLETWHPMRSPWWIAPFAIAIGGEWWWRRRRGMR